MTENHEGLSPDLEKREAIRDILLQLPEALTDEPRHWYRKVARGVLATEQKLQTCPEEVQIYVSPLLQRTKELLRGESHPADQVIQHGQLDDFIGFRAESNIMQLSREMAESFAPNLETIPFQTLSVELLLAEHPDIFRVNEVSENNSLRTFGLKHKVTGEWHDAPLPDVANVWYKGGFARAVLKAHVGASYSEELPWNDLDVVFIGDEAEAHEIAVKMGVDPEGVELVGGQNGQIDFTEYAHGRDITLNQVCFGNDGLRFSDGASDSAETGMISLVSEYMPNRAIYSVDKVRHKGLELIKPRGAMRFVKTVTEGKAASFNYPEVNTNFGLGVYSLILAKRWANKPDFGELMQRFYFLCNKMGVVPQGTNDVYEFLSTTHAEVPFLDLDKKISNMADVARWKAGKIIKQVDREFGWKFGISADVQIQRKENDHEDRYIDMEGYVSSPDISKQITERWPQFLKECHERAQNFAENNPNGGPRYFYESDRNILPDSQADNTVNK